MGLLTGGDHGIGSVIPGADGDLVFAFLHQGADIKGEGDVAALVGTGQLTVDIGEALVIHSAEVENGSAGCLLGGKIDGALVPHAVDEVGVSHAGQFALGAEGDGDGAAEGSAHSLEIPGLSAFALVDFKGPLAVEVHPAVSLELRLGMFGSGNVHIHTLLFCF